MKAERILRRKSCACGTCAACAEAGRTLRRRATGAAPAHEGHAPDSVQRVLAAPGKALEAGVRTFFEARFGHDFSAVRIHTDAPAACAARAVGAAAWTVGQHVAFDAGRFDPTQPQGQELLAHELAHTIQQRGARPAGPIVIGDAADPAEPAADKTAAAALRGGEAPAPRTMPAKLQLQPADPAPQTNLSENASPFLAGAIGSTTVDNFETGKSEVSPANEAKLTATAATIKRLLKKYPAGSVQITGHTDAVGREDSNQVLGQNRAEAVRAVLAQAGLAPEILRTASKGESALLVKSQKAEARNRRVEVHFEPGMAPPSIGIVPPVHLDPMPAAPPPPQKPPLNLNLPAEPPARPGPLAEKRTLPPDFWKEAPKGPKIPGKSVNDVFNDMAHKITSFLPKSLQEKAQPLVKAALKKGTTALLDAALKDVGVDDKGRTAIGKAAEQALDTKFGGSN